MDMRSGPNIWPTVRLNECEEQERFHSELQNQLSNHDVAAGFCEVYCTSLPGRVPITLGVALPLTVNKNIFIFMKGPSSIFSFPC